MADDRTHFEWTEVFNVKQIAGQLIGLRIFNSPSVLKALNLISDVTL